MGLRTWLTRGATARVHVLLVEAPGGFVVRAATERQLALRGWVAAESPADADVLIVCGDPNESFTERADAVFEQLPGPRARIRIPTSQAIVGALDEALGQLRDDAAQRTAARSRAGVPAGEDMDHGDMDHGGMDHGDMDAGGGRDDMDHGDMHDGDMDDGGGHEGMDHDGGGHGDMHHGGHGGGGHEGMDHGGMDHGGGGHGGMDHGSGGHEGMDHGGMDHGDMDMAPAGIPLAEGAPDRDGLELDVLHVKLGPILTSWPAGLVLQCTLHGDVVGDVEVEYETPEVDPAARFTDLQRAAGYLDAVDAVLALAQWPAGRLLARRVRDRCLAAETTDTGRADAAEQTDRLRGKVARSRTLRWMLRDLGRLDPEDLPAPYADALGGDAYERLLGLLDHARAALGPRGMQPTSGPPRRGTSALDGVPRLDELPAYTAAYDVEALLPRLLDGLELASVRIVVATVAPYLTGALGRTTREVLNG
ncbi:hypothetical protein [Cumulibacter manganitolerans]|uniref:hypothetical protein n=1 Tax=Cumulibacter manganitolerans TaxID=1884992 RepID=UPI001E3CEE93|nr:hypothetical protein [Cumulibacter manganitolerans]